MKKMNKHNLLWLITMTLLFLTMACTIFIGGPDFPARSIPLSPASVIELQDQAKKAVEEGAETGEVTLRVSEVQLTSFMVYKLATHPDPPITNPQVYLQNNRMEIYGKVTQGLFTANAKISVEINVSENGQPVIEIASADFGPFPVPDSIKELISNTIKEAYTGSLGPIATGFRIENITIADGLMTITGRIK
ncbi:MAG: hypothetical protein JXA13_13140 [Anaerolineales bacterium]|nr:hypothetical protein [Anaerolineales bacterium]